MDQCGVLSFKNKLKKDMQVKSHGMCRVTINTHGLTIRAESKLFQVFMQVGLCSIAALHVFFFLKKLQSPVVKLYNHKFLYMYSIMGEASIRYA